MHVPKQTINHRWSRYCNCAVSNNTASRSENLFLLNNWPTYESRLLLWNNSLRQKFRQFHLDGVQRFQSGEYFEARLNARHYLNPQSRIASKYPIRGKDGLRQDTLYMKQSPHLAINAST